MSWSWFAAISAQAGPTGCIYIFRPARQSYSCGIPTGCGNGCSFGEYYYDYPWQRLDCATGDPTNSCSSTAENDAYEAWRNANLPPAGAAHCENPWSGVFIGCNLAPEPNTCQNPINNVVNKSGDPVDLTTGALEQSATDIDLGHGLAFKRHYASNRGVTTAMGQNWRHSLDWQLVYKLTDPTGQYQEIVIVRRPFGVDSVFERSSWSPSTWKTGANGTGGLAGSEPGGFTFTDDDGTRVRFDRVSSQTFRLGQIQKPGEPAIAVTPSGAAQTFSAGGATLTITPYTSGTNAGQVQTVSGGGQTWTYIYNTQQQLLTATGPDLSTPGNATDQVVSPTRTRASVRSPRCSARPVARRARSATGPT